MTAARRKGSRRIAAGKDKSLRLLAVATLTCGAVVLSPLLEARARADTPLKIAVGYNRDCGDLEGQATCHLEGAGSKKTW